MRRYRNIQHAQARPYHSNMWWAGLGVLSGIVVVTFFTAAYIWIAGV